jgi:hypothetical protein
MNKLKAQFYSHYLQNYQALSKKTMNEVFLKNNIECDFMNNHLDKGTDIIIYEESSIYHHYPLELTNEFWAVADLDTKKINDEFSLSQAIDTIENLEKLFSFREDRILILSGLPALVYCADMGFDIVKDNNQKNESGLRDYIQKIYPNELSQKEILINQNLYGTIDNGTYSAIDYLNANEELKDTFEIWFKSQYTIKQREYLNYDNKPYYDKHFWEQEKQYEAVQEPMIITNVSDKVICFFDKLSSIKNDKFWELFNTKIKNTFIYES